jgi:two-component system sensor histidine kinase UhpB
MSFSARRLMERDSKNGSSTALSELKKLVEGLTDLSSALRNISHDLHPPSLRYVGIGGALKSLRMTFEETYGIQMDVHVPPKVPALSDEIGLCIYRIAQECLQNIAKHSGASKACITLECSPEEVELTVKDAGRGFARFEALQKGGVGLLSMEERALSIGGHLTLKSGPGSGTEVRLSIPLQHDSVPSTVE